MNKYFTADNTELQRERRDVALAAADRGYKLGVWTTCVNSAHRSTYALFVGDRPGTIWLRYEYGIINPAVADRVRFTAVFSSQPDQHSTLLSSEGRALLKIREWLASHDG